MEKTKEKFDKKRFVFKLVAYALLWAVLLVSLNFSSSIDRIINKTTFDYSLDIASASYRVHFVDVGQGDCILVELPDDKILLIDCGPSSSKSAVLKYFDALNITTINYFVITHSDADHIGNAVAIFENFDVQNVYVPKVYSSYEVENGLDENSEYNVVTTQTWSAVTRAIYAESCLENKIFNDAGVSIASEQFDYSFVFYSPLNDCYSDTNDYSPFIFADITGTKYLFTGDATTDAEEDFLTQYQALVQDDFFDCDILKVAHHGSKNSTSSEFLSAVKPEVAVISVGVDNAYNHPADATINRLDVAGCHIKRTDIMGSIVISSKDGTIFSQSGFNSVNDLYFEWQSIVVGCGILLLCWAVFLFKPKKKDM